MACAYSAVTECRRERARSGLEKLRTLLPDLISAISLPLRPLLLSADANRGAG